MELQAIHDTLKAAGVVGLLGCDEPRPANKKEKDPGRAGMPFLLVDPAEIVPLLTACRDESRLQFDLLIDLTASDPADKDSFFEPTADKIYRHPTFYVVPDDVENM